MDSIPMVAITGQVATAPSATTHSGGRRGGCHPPVTKHNVLVKKVSDLQRIVREAYYIARTGRPGPVLVDIPKDIQVGLVK